MSTDMVSNGDKGVWIHRAVGEVWLAAMSEAIRELMDPPPELLALAEEMEEGLAMDWITGAMMYDFGALLGKPALAAVLRSLHNQIEDDWKAMAPGLIIEGAWQAAPEYAIPELEMLSRLFFDPASVPMPAHIYGPTRGWFIA